MAAKYLEGDYVRALMKRAAVSLPTVRLFRRNVGSIPIPGTKRRFTASLPGQADIYVLGRGGLHLEIEVKRFTGLSPGQIVWRDWCGEWRIPWMLLEVRPREVPAATLDRWVREVGEYLTKLALPDPKCHHDVD